MSNAEQQPAVELVAAFDLIPGHATTVAEVCLWTGRVPEVSDAPRRWVVVRTDDWPMSSDMARQLAAALLRAADRAEAR